MDQVRSILDFFKERFCDIDVDDYEVYVQSIDAVEAEAKDQGVESFVRSHERGAAIRVLKGGRLGMATTSDLSRESLERTIESAIAAMAGATPSDEVGFSPPRPQTAALAERPGRPLHEIPDKEKIDMARRLESSVLASDPRVVAARRPSYREVTKRVALCNSRGVDERASRGLVFCAVQAIAEDGGVSESAAESVHHIRFEDMPCEEIGRRAGERAVALLGAKPLRTGRYRVYLEPRAAAALLKVLMPSFFAPNVQRRKSRLVGQQGKKLFSTMITVVDDGLLPGGAGSYLFDDEGTWHQRTIIVDEGRVAGLLYDDPSAHRDGTRATGNAVRASIHMSPQVGVTNSYIAEGRRSPEDLIRSCDGGLWICDVMGVHTANTITGDFSLGAMGFRIEGGERSSPVRGFMMAGNVLDLFRDVDGVGSDLAFFGAFGAPSLVVSRLQIDGDH